MVNHCQLYQYNKEEYSLIENKEAFFASNFHSLLGNDKVSWLNFHRITNTKEITSLLESLHIDTFLMEEINGNFNRARIEEFDNFTFFKIKSILPIKDQYQLFEEKLSFIISKNYLISFQEKSSDHFPDVRNRIINKIGKIRTKSVDFLLFKLLEAIVENYNEVLDDIVAEVEKLDNRVVLKNTSSSFMRNTLQLAEIQKRRLAVLRKIVAPLKDVGLHIQHSQAGIINKENHVFFYRINDSCNWILEEIEATKQTLDGMTNLIYAINDQKMNEIMKLLTLIGSIFIPLTFIVGVYGMNFEYMPELTAPYGYLAVWGVMIATAIGMIFYFFKRGWFKRDSL